MIAPERACEVSVPTWVENPYRLVSLGEIMKTILASGLLRHGSNLMLYRAPAGVLRDFSRNFDTASTVPTDTPLLSGCLSALRRDCQDLGVHITLPAVKRLLERLDRGMSWAELEVACADIYERLGDELDGTLFLAVDSRHVQYYQTFEKGWETVFANFPSSIPDIEEASKCFALNRYTACVFHLMRVAEAGLAATAKRIGLTNPRPGWEEAISYIEGQLNKKYPEMDAIFKGDVNFLREIAAHM